MVAASRAANKSGRGDESSMKTARRVILFTLVDLIALCLIARVVTGVSAKPSLVEYRFRVLPRSEDSYLLKPLRHKHIILIEVLCDYHDKNTV